MTRKDLIDLIVFYTKEIDFVIKTDMTPFRVIIIFKKPKWYRFILKYRIKKLPYKIREHTPIGLVFEYYYDKNGNLFTIKNNPFI